MPFWEAKCTYCHFAFDPRRPDEARQDRYLRAVLLEMDAAGAGPGDTVYFGGGTPSPMSAERLGCIVETARTHFGLLPAAEVTVEANPRDLDGPGYEALLGIGATRLRLGVQAYPSGLSRPSRAGAFR